MNYQLVSQDGEKSLIVVDNAGKLYPAIHETHPNFTKILNILLEDEMDFWDDEDHEEFLALLDVTTTVAKKFEKVSERVSVSNGQVYFDGDPINSALTKQIVRFMDERVEDWKPLIRFFEKVQSNPSEHSRNQLYDWLVAHDFTLTDNGDIVGYKGVNKKPDGSLISGYAGRAIVDGEVKVGHIPNTIGSIVEMPRSEVTHDPSNPCSTGLHVGTYNYAKHYANGAMLKVEVNPRDVVSVPTDAAGEKVRVCRYQVIEIINAPVKEAVVPSYSYDSEYWGEQEDWEDDFDLDEFDDDDDVQDTWIVTYFR